jgi:hypothetical protein
MFLYPNVVVSPDTPEHRALVQKLSETSERCGQVAFLSEAEFKLLADIKVWPGIEE